MGLLGPLPAPDLAFDGFPDEGANVLLRAPYGVDAGLGSFREADQQLLRKQHLSAHIGYPFVDCERKIADIRLQRNSEK